MGAQSDFIAETFVPSELYKAQQQAMVKNLATAGVNAEALAALFFIPSHLLSGDDPKDN